MKTKLFRICLLALLLAGLVMPIWAQDEPTPDPFPTPLSSELSLSEELPSSPTLVEIVEPVDTATEIRETGETLREILTNTVSVVKDQNIMLIGGLITLAIVVFLLLAFLVVKLLNAKPTNDIEREFLLATLKGMQETLNTVGVALTNVIPGTMDDRWRETQAKMIEDKIRDMAAVAPLPQPPAEPVG